MAKHEGLLFNIGSVVGKEAIRHIPGNPGNTTRLGIPLVILEQTLRNLHMGYQEKSQDDKAELPPGAMIYIEDEPSIDAIKVEIFFLDHKDKDESKQG